MTTKEQSLEGLIERVKAAPGPDRDLDRAVLDALGIVVREFDPGDGDVLQWRAWSDGAKVANTHVTASIDAAIAIVERVLPGWHVEMLRTNYCAVEMWKPDGNGFFNSGRDPIVRRVEAPTLPRAILAATLQALKETSNDH